MKKIKNFILKTLGKRMTFLECEAQRLSLQKILGADIFKRRTALHLSQEKFLEGSGIKQSTFSKVESGDANFTFDTFLRLAKAFNISPVALLRELIFQHKLER